MQQGGQNLFRMLAREGGRADHDLTAAQLDLLARNMDPAGDGVWDFHEQFTLVQLRLVRRGRDIVDGVDRNTQAGEDVNGLFDRATDVATTKWQKVNGEPGTGVVVGNSAWVRTNIFGL